MNDRIVLRNVARVLTEDEINSVAGGAGTTANGPAAQITPGHPTALPTGEYGGVIDQDMTTGDF